MATWKAKRLWAEARVRMRKTLKVLSIDFGANCSSATPYHVAHTACASLDDDRSDEI
jgi:hypothetical protein